MTRSIDFAKKFIANEDAPTMVEYGLMVAMIALIVAMAAAILGQGISSLFNSTANSI
jgi:pilus assembly protein Flp/PilA